MEGKVLLQDLAQSIAAKRKMQRKDAETFLKAFFETISDGILLDKTVKVKGLGTFKMIEVQDRESVNVNTGERIVIPGHSKISFTPDNELKDEVNKPFALFQTVIINEGTSIEEMEKVDTPSVGQEVDVASGIPDTEDIPEDDMTAILPTEETVAISSQPAPLVGEDPASEPFREEPSETEEPDVQEPSSKTDIPVSPASEQEAAQSVGQPFVVKDKRPSWWYVGPAMTGLLFAFFWIVFLVGYFTGSNHWNYLENIFNKTAQNPVIMIDTVLVEKFIEPDSVFVKEMEDSLRNVIREEGRVKNELPEKQVQQPAKPEPKSQTVAEDRKSRAIFEITGLKGVRIIQWGDYLLKIVRQEYGTDDALRYVISYNNFTDPDNLPVGTEVKLPKLKQK